MAMCCIVRKLGLVIRPVWQSAREPRSELKLCRAPKTFGVLQVQSISGNQVLK